MSRIGDQVEKALSKLNEVFRATFEDEVLMNGAYSKLKSEPRDT